MIDSKIKKLRELTEEFLLVEYYSHTNCDMFKIKNVYTRYNEDKQVLCPLSDGIDKALDLAIEYISENKQLFFTTELESLSKRIFSFVDKYAIISPNYEANTGDEKYTCPDVYEMLRCANMLNENQKPNNCFSEWGCGGYFPYTSKEGELEHDYIINKIYFLSNVK